MSASPQKSLASVVLDEHSIGRTTPEKEHERMVAIYDLIESNLFSLPGHDGGPYALTLAMIENKLSLDIRSVAGETLIVHVLSLTPFRRVLRDYFLICESYYAAIKTSSPTQIEAIDMGRRGLHDEAAQLLMERLDGKVEIDFNTARRLFTLIAALHWKG
jgi:uncharacterized protein (UPF0262 family)